MVYCTKCGTKNEEDVEYCTKCGAKLWVSREKRLERRAEEWGEEFGRRAERECFGLPHGGTIAGLIIGIIIILVGFSWIAGIDVGRYVWPLVIVVFGMVIVAGALYSYTRR